VNQSEIIALCKDEGMEVTIHFYPNRVELKVERDGLAAHRIATAEELKLYYGEDRVKAFFNSFKTDAVFRNLVAGAVGTLKEHEKEIDDNERENDRSCAIPG